MKITFLHTSRSHIQRFTAIVEKLDQSIVMAHYVNEELLEYAKKIGKVDEIGFRKEVNKIRAKEKGLIVCTCSTYGELCDEKDNIYRIDQAVGEYIIANFSTVGVAYTLDSTKEISKRLFEKLTTNQKTIQIKEIDCTEVWHHFENDNIEQYEAAIANQIRERADDCEVVFLAQASMEGAKQHLENEIYQVVSSPEIGVRKYLKLLESTEFQ